MPEFVFKVVISNCLFRFLFSSNSLFRFLFFSDSCFSQSVHERENSRGSEVSGVYRRSRQSKAGDYVRYEPRFKPPRETLASGETPVYNCLALGGYDTLEEAQIVHQIAAFCYGKAGPHLDLGNGCLYTIDSESWNEQLDSRHGNEKAKWVAGKAKEVFQDFKKTKASTVLFNATNNLTSVLHPGEQIANVRDSSHPCAKANASLSAAIYTSPEVHLASSSGASPLDTIESRFAETVSNVAVNRDLNTEGAIPHVEPALSTLDQGFIEPMSPTTGWQGDAKFFGADQDTDFSLECPLEGNIEECAYELNDFDVSFIEVASCLLEPGSATVNEEDPSLLRPCSSESEGTILNDIQGYHPGAAISIPMIDEGSQQKSLPLGPQEDAVDALSLFTDPNLCNQHFIADQLLEVASLCQQRIKEQDRNLVDYERENSELKRLNSELERRNNELVTIKSELEHQVKRLRGI